MYTTNSSYLLLIAAGDISIARTIIIIVVMVSPFPSIVEEALFLEGEE